MTYTSSNIKVLKGLEAVRVRPGMYIGNTDDGTGLHHLVYEVTDNSVDEALAGHCTYIKIHLHSDGSVSVQDNGRGIPTDIHAEEGMSAAQVIMTQLHAGGKFDNNTYKVSGGLHGVGISVVNALSEWLELIIVRNKQIHFMRFEKGVAQAPLKIISRQEYQSYGQVYTSLEFTQGTYIRFIPDKTIFAITDFLFSTLAERYQELSFLNPGLKFELSTDKTDVQSAKTLIFYDTGGVKSFVELNSSKQTLLFDKIIQIQGEQNDITVDLALCWTSTSYNDNTLCFTNNIPQKEGGTHLQGFRTALTKIVQKFIPDNKLKGMQCSGDDIREGIYAILSVKVPNPRFSSQTKEKLVSSEVRTVVEQIVQEKLDRFLEENPQYTKLIVERVLESIRAKEAAKKARALVRQNKTGDNNISIAGKLADCSSKKPHEKELFLVEGQSAGGTAKMARNRENQAVLALQGKLLNVEKAILAKILQYEAIRLIITVLGAGVGDQCLAENCKYHKIIIMTDADVDGSHIRTLLLTFFFRYMRPIIEAGYLYVSRPPLYAIKSKKHNPVYLADDHQLNQYIVNSTAKTVEIYQNNQLLENKQEFYMNALEAIVELEQFQDFTAYVLESKMLTTFSITNTTNSSDDTSAVTSIINYNISLLQSTLQKYFKHTSVTQQNNTLLIEIIKHDKLIVKTLSLKPLKHLDFINNWQSITLNIHSKTHNITTILDFEKIINQIQSNMFEISRFKGLGEMNPKELRETGIDPKTRIIEQVTFQTFEYADETIRLLMGDDVVSRRAFIETNAWNACVDV